MIRFLLALTLLACVGCKEEVAQDTSPLPLSQDSVGHFCQMDLLEHDGPKGQAHLAGLPGLPLFFSQVRDVIAYTRMPEQSHEILAVWVNDMGASGATWSEPGRDNWILAQEAVYVVGSRVVGGMGTPEIVPFSDHAQATDFVEANGGQAMRLAEIPDAAVLAPVELTGDGDDADFDARLRALATKSGG